MDSILVYNYNAKKKKHVFSPWLTLVRLMALFVTGVYYLFSDKDKRKIFYFHSEKNCFQKYYYKKYNQVSYLGYLKKSGVVSSLISGDKVDFKGIYLPFVAIDKDNFFTWASIAYGDIFITHMEYNDDYSAKNIDYTDKFVPEGSYFYVDNDIGIDITVNEGDIVFDAGAWRGDFSALASFYGATVYAFEPSNNNFKWLQETAKMNKNIIPVHCGVGAKSEKLYINMDEEEIGRDYISSESDPQKSSQTQIVSLDDFVKDNEIKSVDFIKADIEGFERQMLQGATWILQNYEPKISICTYHILDDPQVLRKMISEANPKYKFMQRKRKLFAWV